MRSPVAVPTLLALSLLAASPFTAPPAAAQDVAPGTKFEIRPDALPKPYATDAVANQSETVARTDAMRPQVPKGMTATLFASGLSGPREMLVLPDRSILVSEPEAGRISRLVAPNPPARARAMPFLTGLDQPYGMALRRDALYIADLDGLWRVPYAPGDAKAQAKPQRITPDGAFDGGNGHHSRNVIWDPGSDQFFVAIGSRSNIAEEPVPRATIQVFAPDGSGGRTYASGLRNPVGLALQPGTGRLYTVVNERDGLGNGLVPDYLTAVREGGFYGWPYAYLGQNPQPDLADKQPGPGEAGDRAGPAVRVAFGAARPGLLRRVDVPRLARRRAGDAARLVEPRRPDRLHGGPGAVPGRQARGRLRGAGDRLPGQSRRRRGPGLGPSRRDRGTAGRVDPGLRR